MKPVENLIIIGKDYSHIGVIYYSFSSRTKGVCVWRKNNGVEAKQVFLS